MGDAATDMEGVEKEETAIVGWGPNITEMRREQTSDSGAEGKKMRKEEWGRPRGGLALFNKKHKSGERTWPSRTKVAKRKKPETEQTTKSNWCARGSKPLEKEKKQLKKARC